jgi:hypothetical protein
MGSYERDRRRYKRVGVDKSVLPGDDFVALDLSESGMQLLSTVEYRKGRELELTLKMNAQSIPLKAEVVWCRKSSSVFEIGYHLGVQFVGHSVGEQLVIREYVDSVVRGTG